MNTPPTGFSPIPSPSPPTAPTLSSSGGRQRRKGPSAARPTATSSSWSVTTPHVPIPVPWPVPPRRRRRGALPRSISTGVSISSPTPKRLSTTTTSAAERLTDRIISGRSELPAARSIWDWRRRPPSSRTPLITARSSPSSMATFASRNRIRSLTASISAPACPPARLRPTCFLPPVPAPALSASPSARTIKPLMWPMTARFPREGAFRSTPIMGRGGGLTPSAPAQARPSGRAGWPLHSESRRSSTPQPRKRRRIG